MREDQDVEEEISRGPALADSAQGIGDTMSRAFFGWGRRVLVALRLGARAGIRWAALCGAVALQGVARLEAERAVREEGKSGEGTAAFDRGRPFMETLTDLCC